MIIFVDATRRGRKQVEQQEMLLAQELDFGKQLTMKEIQVGYKSSWHTSQVVGTISICV